MSAADRAESFADLDRARGWMGDRARGAQYGRPSREAEGGRAARFTVSRVRVDEFGYDDGGAYWGIGQPLFRFVGTDNDPMDPPPEGYVRARGKAEATREFRRCRPGAQVIG